jgi:hypothetical protein
MHLDGKPLSSLEIAAIREENQSLWTCSGNLDPITDARTCYFPPRALSEDQLGMQLRFDKQKQDWDIYI